MKLDVCFTPQEYRSSGYSGNHTAVVIDVLRATTCMAAAFIAGCRRLIPAASVVEAKEFARQYPDALLAGERRALHIPGFDIGNSPLEYTATKVAGRTVIITTTNGTTALTAARTAAKVYIAAFVNTAAVSERLMEDDQDTVIVCAGTNGCFSLEDALCAGYIADRLGSSCRLGDSATMVQAAYRQISPVLIERLGDSGHAAYLKQLGFAADVDYCLQRDIITLVPVYSGETVEISG